MIAAQIVTKSKVIKYTELRPYRPKGLSPSLAAPQWKLSHDPQKIVLLPSPKITTVFQL